MRARTMRGNTCRALLVFASPVLAGCATYQPPTLTTAHPAHPEAPAAREAPVTRDDLRGAREAFLASTLREVQPVRSIDGRALPAVPGPLTAAAAEAFARHVRDSL